MKESSIVKKIRVVSAKMRKAPGGASAAILKGTTAGHYMQFINDALDIMDKFHKMEGVYIVVDNVPDPRS